MAFFPTKTPINIFVPPVPKVMVTAAMLLATLLVNNVAHAVYRWPIADSQLPGLQQWLTQYPQYFAGLSVDSANAEVTVRYAEHQDLATTQHLLDHFPRVDNASEPLSSQQEWHIALQPVARSRADLEAIQQQLMTREPLASLLQPLVSQWSIDVVHNAVNVGVVRLRQSLLEDVQRAFGDAVTLVERPRLRRYSRTVAADDGTLSGGAQIYRPSGTRCSSGFPVELDGSLRGFTTAGHCALNQPDYPTITNTDEKYLGNLLSFHWGFAENQGFGIVWSQETDASLIFDYLFSGQAQPVPKVYVGGTNSNTRRYIRGYREPLLGETVCFSGALSGENCRAVITNTDVSAVFYIDGGIGMLLSGLVEASSWDGSVIARPGDSGGPVYVKENIGWNQVVTGVGAIEGGPSSEPSSTAYLVPISKVAPDGWELVAASCDWYWGLYICE